MRYLENDGLRDVSKRATKNRTHRVCAEEGQVDYPIVGTFAIAISASKGLQRKNLASQYYTSLPRMST